MKFEKVIKEHFNGNMVSKVTKKVLKEDYNKFLTEGANAELYKNAMAAYKNDDDNFFYDLSDDELVTLWVSCAITKDNPYGAAYDDEVFEAISERENSRELFDRAADIIKGESNLIKESQNNIDYDVDNVQRWKVSMKYDEDFGNERWSGIVVASSEAEAIDNYKYKVGGFGVGWRVVSVKPVGPASEAQKTRWARTIKNTCIINKKPVPENIEQYLNAQYMSSEQSIEEEVELTICPNCSGERFNDNTGLCVDCGYDEKGHGDLDESKSTQELTVDTLPAFEKEMQSKYIELREIDVYEDFEDSPTIYLAWLKFPYFSNLSGGGLFHFESEEEFHKAMETSINTWNKDGILNGWFEYQQYEELCNIKDWQTAEVEALRLLDDYLSKNESKSIKESTQSYDIMLEDDDCIIDFRTGTLKVSLQVLDDFVKDSVIRIKFVEEPDVTYEYKMISVDGEYITMEQLDRFNDELDSNLYNESLSSRLVDFYKDYDFHNYTDTLEVGDTDEDAIKKMDKDLTNPEYVNGLISKLTDISNEEELDDEQKEIDKGLISDLKKLSPINESLNESPGGRFELSIWVPGSGGDDDRERTLLRSDNMQEIIDTAYNTDLDDDEAFYLSDWKGIYSTDLDQCYDAEELEDQIYNVWFYSPEADMRRTLGKILLPQNESEEPAQDKKPLNEGPGAGYTVEGVITNVNIHNVNDCKFQRSDEYGNYYEVSLVASAMFEDVEAHSYYYGGKVGDMPIHISHCVICMDGVPTDEDIYDALSGAKIKVLIGGGWSHTTFDGRINASVDNREIDTYYDVLDSVIFDISEVNFVLEIDDLVTGAFDEDEEDMDESINESYQEVAYINDGYTNFRVVGGGFNTRDALVSVEDADGRPSRLSMGDVVEFYTWYDAKGNVIREPEDMDESLNEDLESRLVNIFGDVAPEDDYDGYCIANSPICVNTNAIDKDGNPTSGLLFYTNDDYLIPSVADGELDIQAPDFIDIDGVNYGDMLQFTRKLSDEELKKIVDELISKAKKYADEDDDSSNVMW